MKVVVRFALCLVVASVYVAAPLRPSLAADEGEKTFEQSCVNCHTPEVMKDRLKGKAPTHEEWSERDHQENGWSRY